MKTASKISRIKETNSKRGKEDLILLKEPSRPTMGLSSQLDRLATAQNSGSNHQRLKARRNCPAMAMLSFALRKMDIYKGEPWTLRHVLEFSGNKGEPRERRIPSLLPAVPSWVAKD